MTKRDFRRKIRTIEENHASHKKRLELKSLIKLNFTYKNPNPVANYHNKLITYWKFNIL